MPGDQGDEPPESVVTSGVAPRVPLAMSNDDAHMWALADMSSARADQSMPSVCIREWSEVRLSARRMRLRANLSEHPVAPYSARRIALLRRLERKAAELTLVEMARDATIYTSSAVGTCYF